MSKEPPSSRPGLFITGTDTGVGKTALAASLLAAIRADGIDAAPMKPVQTGCDGKPGALRAPDLDLCLRAGGMTPSPTEQDWMCPYRFRPACSPHLAAEQAGEAISPRRMLAAYFRLRRRYGFIVVEGAGGVRVPIGPDYDMLDLMRDVALPVVIASRPRLGTLNHTLLTLDAVRDAGLQVAGVVLVDTEPIPWGAIEHDNRRTIAERGGTRVFGVLPYAPAWETPGSPARNAAQAIWRSIRDAVQFQ